ncbi:hypothetical protein GCM10009839_69730 [Catenulispora yoronensis]|uniref:Beta-N-acetylhexosaminidase n=1 Tax=Catenulispora yoronensis TaxID=450799 RepID=A0ABP5GRQ7_9ACTN
MQQWTAGSGNGFTWSQSSRVVVNTADSSSLSGDAQTLASDLRLAFGANQVPVVTGALSAAQPGDVFLSLGSTDTQLGNEGYGLTIAPVLQVKARTEAGAFWATQTVLQLLHQQTALPAGTVRDWPNYRVRAVLVDDGQRSFPLSWWFNEIRQLSYLKMNEITFTANRAGLTADQQAQVEAYAAKYHVPVTPVVPMPSYMQAVEPQLPAQYTLTNAAGLAMVGALDLSNPAAVSWALQQTSNSLGSFSGPAWHTGADEYPDASHHLSDTADFPKLVNYAHQQYGSAGTPEDLYRAFINQNDNLVRQSGKSMRMWGDDLFPSSAVALNSDITVEEWDAEPGSLTPAQVAANGNQVVNADMDYLYYDEGSGPTTTPARIWEQFDPGRFATGQTLPQGAADPHLAGIEMAQWDSAHEDPGQLEVDLGQLNEALAQRAWGSAKQFPTWAQMQGVVGAIGRPPGFVPTPLGPRKGAVLAKAGTGLYGWTTESDPVVTAMASNAGVQMILDTTGTVWAKTGISLYGWTQESDPGVSAIAVGSDGLQMIVAADGCAYAKYGIGLYNWTKESDTGIKAIATNGGTQMIVAADGSAYAKTSVGLYNWTKESDPGIKAIAVNSHGLQMIVAADGSAYAKQEISLYNWTRESDPGIKAIAVGSDGLQMIVAADGCAYAKYGIGLYNWTKESDPGVKAITTNGGVQLIIAADGAVWSKRTVSLYGWSQESDSGAKAVVEGSDGLEMILWS